MQLLHRNLLVAETVIWTANNGCTIICYLKGRLKLPLKPLHECLIVNETVIPYMYESPMVVEIVTWNP